MRIAILILCLVDICFIVLAMKFNHLYDGVLTNIAFLTTTLKRDEKYSDEEVKALQEQLKLVSNRLAAVEADTKEFRETYADQAKEELKQQQAMTDGMNNLFNFGNKLYGGDNK